MRSVVLKNFLPLSLVLTIELHTSQWKNHCSRSKHVRKKLSISVDLNIRKNLAIGTCLKRLASTRKKLRCRGHFYTLASTPHSTDQRSSFNQNLNRLIILVKTAARTFGIIKIIINAILCSECNYWFHMKCLKMSSSIIKFYLIIGN